MKQYLAVTETINWQHPKILQLADELSQGRDHPEAIAKACFEWVREQIFHSSDYKMNPVKLFPI